MFTYTPFSKAAYQNDIRSNNNLKYDNNNGKAFRKSKG